MNRHISWPRILVEGTAIVVSILLAFGIQAWWEGQQEREAEQDLLRGLLADFQTNLTRLATIVGAHEDMVATFAEMRAMSTEERAAVHPDSVWHFTRAMGAPRTFAPVDATLDAVIASGRLELIRDPQLRDLLVEWKSRLVDVDEEASRLYDAGNRVGDRLVALRAPLTLPPDAAHDALPGLGAARSNWEQQDLNVLASDARLIELAQIKMLRATVYLFELRPLAEHAEEIRGLIEASIE